MQAANVAERGELLNQHFTYSLYVNVCRSLFERHKLLFSFILTMKIMQHAGAIDPAEWRFLLAGPVNAGSGSGADSKQAAGSRGSLVNPASNWLTDKSWSELLGLSELPAFAGLVQHVTSQLAHYKAIFDSNQVRIAGNPVQQPADVQPQQKHLK